MKNWILIIGVGLFAGIAAGVKNCTELGVVGGKLSGSPMVMDGKIGVWMHWGIPSAVDEYRPSDGSWYGRNMYGGGKAMAKTLSEWHTKRYGPPVEVGYEQMIPLEWKLFNVDLFSVGWGAEE